MRSIIIESVECNNRMGDDYEGSTSKSLAIPLPMSHIHRTESELLLYENMAQAEYQDQCMFNRLVSGIRCQQQLLYHVETHDRRRGGPINQEHQDKHRRLDSSVVRDTMTDCDDEQNNEFSGFFSPLNSTTPEDAMEENQRSIDNITRTRRAPVISKVDSCLQMFGMMNEKPHLVPNDINSYDDSREVFGEIFDLEL